VAARGRASQKGCAPADEVLQN